MTTADAVRPLKLVLLSNQGKAQRKHRTLVVRSRKIAPPFSHNLFPPMPVLSMLTIFGKHPGQFRFQTLLAEFVE